MTGSVPVRVAVVGCGAVARLYHAPALQALEREGRVHVVAAYDPDAAALNPFCDSFPGARPSPSFDALLAVEPDLLIVSSPPRHHADQGIAALESGIDVHCEKPLAPTLADGERMVAAASAAGRRLTVGLVRRHFPAIRAIRHLIGTGALGRLESVECFEGGPFDWPVRSAGYFRPNAGGGVLADIGTHCLDLLAWWFGPPTDVAYEDDAMGGVEANCRITLSFGDVPATVRLSRDWSRPNRYVITGSEGWLGWTVNDANHLDLGIGSTGDVGEVVLHRASPSARSSLAAPAAADFHEAFADQVRALVAPVGDGPDRSVAGEVALATMELLERCAAGRRPMAMPWLEPPERSGS